MKKLLIFSFLAQACLTSLDSSAFDYFEERNPQAQFSWILTNPNIAASKKEHLQPFEERNPQEQFIWAISHRSPASKDKTLEYLDGRSPLEEF